jgi:hypothetical protein
VSVSDRTTWDDEHGVAHNLRRRPFWNGQTTIVSTRCGIFKVLSGVELVSGRDLREEKDADCMACVACLDEGP